MQTVGEVASPGPAVLDRFARDVREGLARRPKTIPSMHFYDDRGSRLFRQITRLTEYYPTHCEREILETHAAEIARTVAAQPLRVVEFGAGDGHKTEVLLRRFLDDGLEFEYVPIDICRQSIEGLCASLRAGTGPRRLRIRGVVAEYLDGLAAVGREPAARNLVLFLGSNVGNLAHPEARRFLRSLRRALQPGDWALIGFDLKKDPEVLRRAYDDPAGVTREFNLNLLDRINRELGGRFDRSRFRHYATYNPRQAAMESWLVSLENQRVPVRALDRVFAFRTCGPRSSAKSAISRGQGFSGPPSPARPALSRTPSPTVPFPLECSAVIRRANAEIAVNAQATAVPNRRRRQAQSERRSACHCESLPSAYDSTARRSCGE